MAMMWIIGSLLIVNKGNIMKRWMLTIAIFMCVNIQGCMQVASTGASCVYNRHGLEESFNDQYKTYCAYRALDKCPKDFKNTNISLTTYHGEILIAGQVPESWQRNKVETLVKSVPDIDRVYNLLTISSPSSSLTRVSDAWITSKIKTKLLASNDVDASKVKVITENGTVYLMGILQTCEADAAVDIASNTDGVARVVRVFSYMKISKKRA